jgi:CHAT domain-containing protein/uncharacterized protein HemY
MRHHSLGVLTGIWALALVGLLPGRAAGADDPALKSLVEQFYAAYAREDLEGFMALWSSRSPDFSSRRQVMKEIFEATDHIAVSSLDVRRTTVAGDEATVRVVVSMAGMDTKTRQPASGFGRLNRTLRWVKEGAAWKVWRYVPSEVDLAEVLAAANTEAEREVLLTVDAELVTADLVQALRQLGDPLYTEGKYAQALRHYQLARAVAERSGDRAGEADALYDIGVVFYDQAQYAEALEHLQHSLRLYEMLGNRAAVAVAVNSLGNVHLSQARYAEALECYQRSLQLREELGDRAGTAVVLNGLGNVHQSRGDWQQALQAYQRSMELYEALGNRRQAARTRSNIANVYFDQADYPRALREYEECLKVHEELGDRKGSAAAHNNIGNVYYSLGDYEAARRHLERGLELNQQLGDRQRLAQGLLNLANVLVATGDFARAETEIQQSLKLHEELGDRAGLASVLNNIGVTHHARGNEPAALEYFQRSLKLHRELGHQHQVPDIVMNIANVYHSQGDYARALEHLLISLEQYERLRNPDGTGKVLNNIGNIYAAQSNYAQALEFHQRSLKIMEGLGAQAEVANALHNIGLAYQGLWNLQRALECHQRSLGLYQTAGHKEGVAKSLSSIGSVYALRREFPKALEYYRRSLAQHEALGNRAGMAVTLTNIGVLHRVRKQYAAAMQAYRQSLAHALAVGAATTVYRCYWGIAEVYQEQGQRNQAVDALEKAFGAIEKLRGQVVGAETEQQQSFENKVGAYHSMISLQVRANQTERALHTAERARARVLLDVLQSGRAKITAAMTAQERDRERALVGRLRSLNAQIAQGRRREASDPVRGDALAQQLHGARQEYEEFRTRLYAAHPELRTQRGEASILTLEEARELLPDAKTALLEYTVTATETYLFVLTRQPGGAGVALKVYRLPVAQEALQRRAQRFRLQLSRPYLIFGPSARRLYDQLLRPAEGQLRGKRTLVIVPDGPLWELPFQALQPRRGRFLLEEFALSYAPSLTVLRESRRQEQRGRSGRTAGARPTLLAFGNPSLGGQTVRLARLAQRGETPAPLPAAQAEVRALSRLYGEAQSRVFTGAAAAEECLKAQIGASRVLHFATHGLLDNTSPMYSHLLLAQPADGSREDGLLEAWELLQMELNAELAVLSACETARGRVGAGEGMIGLSWALFVAGCPTTVVSQWKVADASTARLMVAFHRELRAGQGKAAALRVAALKLRRAKATAHPYYWAPFVLVGDGR